jgi:hypothetical protein
VNNWTYLHDCHTQCESISAGPRPESIQALIWVKNEAEDEHGLIQGSPPLFNALHHAFRDCSIRVALEMEKNPRKTQQNMVGTAAVALVDVCDVTHGFNVVRKGLQFFPEGRVIKKITKSVRQTARQIYESGSTHFDAVSVIFLIAFLFFSAPTWAAMISSRCVTAAARRAGFSRMV